jgi:uncharacterized protein YqiB (DUF1249 family)
MFTLRVTKSQPEYVTYRERYKVDLPLQMAECELNYVRLAKLFEDKLFEPKSFETKPFDKKLSDAKLTKVSDDEYRFMISRGDQQWLHLLRVVERSRYTTTLQFSQTLVASHSSWLPMPRLVVRMYHDAKLAEVLAWEGHKRLRPRYEYPNRAMYHADEKLQINQFLGEWLMLCLNEGHSIEEVMPMFVDGK